MAASLTESVVEHAALAWLASLSYQVKHGPEIAPSEAGDCLDVQANDLDDQLFGTFARCHELLRQQPVQAESRADLRKKLQVASGGVIFTTIQKFFPEEKGDRYPALSDRRNIVVIADEAHRSQYDFIDGFARHMRAALVKSGPDGRRTSEEVDHAIRQIVSGAIASGEVIDVFAAVGLKKPDLSILSDEFLAEVRELPQRNLAVELLRKLLTGEIKTRSQKNVV